MIAHSRPAMPLLHGESPRSSKRCSDQRGRGSARDWAGECEVVGEFGEAGMAQCAARIAPYTLIGSVPDFAALIRASVTGLDESIPFSSSIAAIKTRTYFAFRIDVWDDAGDSIYEHVVGSEDFEVAVAAYFAACQRWPQAKITLRQGARVVKKNW
jgi:hypothetical protein